MQPFRWTSIASFAALMAALSSLAATSAAWLAPWCSGFGDYRSIVVTAFAFACLYGYALGAHRLFLHLFPLAEGLMTTGTAREFRYQVYSLFYLILFNALIRSRSIPIPLMRLIYQLLGARLGANTYSAGILFDPSMVVIGANSLVGESAMLVPHVIEGPHLAHYRIVIGSNVTIGACTVILAGVSIGDHAMVAANSVVTKGCCIPPGEVWGGTPACRLRRSRSSLPVTDTAPAIASEPIVTVLRSAHREEG
ncbi:MAG: acyltransferase [Pseudomonadota bacterium]|nr:acyltransferase [Pseudomonadota bacterium]